MESVLIGSLLGVSFLDDLLTRKVHNLLILLFLVPTLIYFSAFNTWDNIQWQSLLLCQIACLPLVYLRILGAGDWKLFCLISLFFTPAVFLPLFLNSFIWNAIGGTLKFSLLSLRGSSLSFKEKMLFPFTFGILISWISVVFFNKGAFL